MTLLQAWLDAFPSARFTPLFAMDDHFLVQTHQRSREGDRRILTRSPAFEAAMIELIEEGLQNESWQGLVYLMGVGDQQAFTPLYVGKAERQGKIHTVSKNIVNIRNNPDKFARWGYGLDYHVGDLRHAMFGFAAYRGPTKKYRCWAEALFVSTDPPVLHQPVHMMLIPWFEGSRGPSGLRGSVASVEKEVIALASALHADRLLNVDGR